MIQPTFSGTMFFSSAHNYHQDNHMLERYTCLHKFMRNKIIQDMLTNQNKIKLEINNNTI